MKNDRSVVRQASWSPRWATRALDALALWGAIKSSAVDTMPMSDYVTPGSVDEPLARPSVAPLRRPKGTDERAPRGRNMPTLGLAPLALSVGEIRQLGAPS